MTTAKRFARVFSDNGQCYETPQGETLDEIARGCGAIVEKGDGSYDEKSNRRIGVSWLRYIFKDGSAIVDCGTGWDIEGSVPWSWAGTE